MNWDKNFPLLQYMVYTMIIRTRVAGISPVASPNVGHKVVYISSSYCGIDETNATENS